MTGNGAPTRRIGPAGPERRPARRPGQPARPDQPDGRPDRQDGDAWPPRRPALTPPEDLLGRTLFRISAVTAVTGLVQVAAPGIVLRLLRCENTPATRHGFATVGMFMVVVGGGGGHALASAPPHEANSWVFWTGMQKLGAAAAVGIGVRRKIFAKPATLVAINDLASGVLALAWCARQRWAGQPEGPPERRP